MDVGVCRVDGLFDLGRQRLDGRDELSWANLQAGELSLSEVEFLDVGQQAGVALLLDIRHHLGDAGDDFLDVGLGSTFEDVCLLG